MDVRVVAPGDVARAGAAVVADALAASGRADATLMPALGSSALGIYAELAAMRARGELDTAGLRLVQLDEYLVGAADPRSLRGWLGRVVAGPLGIPDERVIEFDGASPDPQAACRGYDAAVAAAGGIDVAVLGLGPNGHLGFNEPPADASAPTRLVDLDPLSIAANTRYWPGLDVPRQALTAGMPVILGARRILLVVTGAAKRDVLRSMLEGEPHREVPASFVRECPQALLLADDAAWPFEAVPS